MRKAELPGSLEAPPLAAGTNRQKQGDSHLQEYLQNLTVVLDRLWLFYQAMHTGKPLQDCVEVLTQARTALSSVTGPGNSGEGATPGRFN